MAVVSVIIPVYNCEKYIAGGIESIQKQTFQDWELILVNDGSTDKSGEICQKYAEKDSRIRIVEKENGGGGGEARNVGMQHASAPFFAFLDSDDYYKETMLETLVNAQKEEDYDVVIVGYEEFSEQDSVRYPVTYSSRKLRSREEVRDFFVRHYPEGLLGFPWNKLYRASIIREHQLKMPKMRRLEDGIFNVEFFGRCNSCRIVERVEHCYRESRQVEQGKLPYQFYDIMEVFVEHYYESLRKWNYSVKESEQSIVDYFQNDFVCCLENIFQPVWKQTKKEKVQYIKELREKELVKYMLDKPCMTGKYTEIAIRLYRARCYAGLRLVMWTKNFLKTKCSGIFYRLKERVN